MRRLGKPLPSFGSGCRRPSCIYRPCIYRRTARYRKRRWILAAFLACVVTSLSSCSSASTHPLLTHPSQESAPTWNPGSDWKLTWSDDFTGTDSLRDWNLITGGGGWGHKELQGYSAENVTVGPSGGLIITASKDGHGSQCWYGVCKYSSGRLDTKGLFQQAYGVFAARIKLPAGRGLWPAFWMEGTNPLPYGEVDIIESNNQKPDLVSAFAHSSNISHGAYLQLPSALSAGYHVYAMEWTRNSLSWLIDGRTYGRMPIPTAAPFDRPFYLILDLAVGGVWPGPPDAATAFPARMYVSWIHVYSHK